jgi:hypothetical protein
VFNKTGGYMKKILLYVFLIVIAGCSSESLIEKGDYFEVVNPKAAHYGEIFRAYSGQLPDRWKLPNYVFGQNQKYGCATVLLQMSDIAKVEYKKGDFVRVIDEKDYGFYTLYMVQSGIFYNEFARVGQVLISTPKDPDHQRGIEIDRIKKIE